MTIMSSVAQNNSSHGSDHGNVISSELVVAISFIVFFSLVCGGYCMRKLLSARRRYSIDQKAMNYYIENCAESKEEYQPPSDTMNATNGASGATRLL
jgi:hypothetical protein